MANLLRDWKPGKTLSRRTRAACRWQGHMMRPFRPSPHDVAEGEEFPTYFSECRLCNRFAILVFDDPKDYHAFGSAIKDRCDWAREMTDEQLRRRLR